MEASASAVLIGACAAVSVISFAAAYLAELVIPVQTKAAPAARPPPKEKTLEERVEFIEKKEGIAPPPAPPPVLPSAPPAPPVQTQLTVG